MLLSLDYTSEENKEVLDLLLQCFHRPVYIRNDDVSEVRVQLLYLFLL